jgi:hypothetical protein
MPIMLRRLWIQLTADRKRFGLLCAMLSVGLLLWARVIVVSNIPRTAAATDGQNATEPDERDIRAGTAITDRHAKQPVKVRLDEAPARDPFVISTVYFPKSHFDGEINQEAAKSSSKLDETEIELRLRRQHERLRQQVQRLKLEAVMTGAELAVISGRTYRLGDDVPSNDDRSVVFELVEVKQRSVVLQSGGLVFVLEMTSP